MARKQPPKTPKVHTFGGTQPKSITGGKKMRSSSSPGGMRGTGMEKMTGSAPMMDMSSMNTRMSGGPKRKRRGITGPSATQPTGATRGAASPGRWSGGSGGSPTQPTGGRG